MNKARAHYAAIPFNLATLLFATVFILRIFSNLAATVYDWDIDHEMYFGSRLLSGELLYTLEYHDKLPVVQYLFLIPAAFNSVRLWVLFSIFMSICAALAMRRSLIIMLSDSMSNAKLLVRPIALFGSSFYLLLISSFPGSISHINPVATSFTVLSIYFLLAFKRASSKFRISINFLFAAFCGSIAISIRPYLAPPVVLLGIWISSRELISPSLPSQIRAFNSSSAFRNIRYVVSSTLFWTGLLVLVGVLINFLPYFLTGSSKFFLDGIRHNSQFLNPQNARSILIQQSIDINRMGSLIFILCLSGILASFYVLLKKLISLRSLLFNVYTIPTVPEIDIAFLGLVSIVLLELTILSRHYWPHYQQLFSPYLAFSFSIGVAMIFNQQSVQIRIKSRRLIAFAFFGIFLVSLGRAEIYSSFKALRDSYGIHPQFTVYQDISAIVHTREKRGLSTTFLHVSHMYTHWRLNQSRHGFPHAANFGQIEANWLESLEHERIQLIDFPYSKSQLCDKILVNGPTVVVADKGSSTYHCLTSNLSTYRFLVSPSLVTPNLVAFEKE